MVNEEGGEGMVGEGERVSGGVNVDRVRGVRDY